MCWTVTPTCFVTVPPQLNAYNVKVVLLAGDTSLVPLAGTSPTAWSIEDVKAPVTVHLSVVTCPAMIVFGEAPKAEMVGFEQGVLVGVEVGGFGVAVGGGGVLVRVGESVGCGVSAEGVPDEIAAAVSVGVPTSCVGVPRAPSWD